MVGISVYYFEHIVMALYAGKESPHGHKLWVGNGYSQRENTYYVMLIKGWRWGRLWAESLAERRTPQALGGSWDSVSCGDDGWKILSLFKMWTVLASFGFGFWHLNWPQCNTTAGKWYYLDWLRGVFELNSTAAVEKEKCADHIQQGSEETSFYRSRVCRWMWL